MIGSSRRLARNVAYNLAGQVAPLVVALVSIPLLIDGLGASRFGVLTLAWAAIGYFSLFDFGIGRALTQALSAGLARDGGADAGAITWTALWLMLALGALGAAAVALAAPSLVGGALKIAPALVPECVLAFQLLALSLPFVVTTVGLRGVLEAYQEFGVATALRLPYAIFTFVGPLLVLPFTRSVAAVVGVLAVARVALWGAHLLVVRRRHAELGPPMVFRRALVPALLRTGGWMTVSNVISPLMVTVDRFLLAGLIGASAVAYYVTPYEVAVKLLLVPQALLGVLFPAFAATFVVDPAATARRAEQAVRFLVAAMFPPVLALVALAPEGLRVWVGAEFSAAGAPVLQWLAVGVLINAVGHVPHGLLQGVGRSDLTAKLHLLELPVYLAALWALARTFGVVGVAMAWTLRVALDTSALLLVARRLLPAAPRGAGVGPVAFLSLVAALGAVASVGAAAPRLALATAVLAAFAAFAWARLVRAEERAALRLPWGRARLAG